MQYPHYTEDGFIDVIYKQQEEDTIEVPSNFVFEIFANNEIVGYKNLQQILQELGYSDLEDYKIKKHNKDIIEQIESLEKKQNRTVREALIANPQIDTTKLEQFDKDIESLRGQLK